MRQRFSSLVVVLALGMAFSAPLAAQPPRETPAQTVDLDDDNDGFDLGWLGLVGLAGLLGLRRREVHDVHTVRTDPNRPSPPR